MTELLALLSRAAAGESCAREVALLLSGGLDSVSVGIALETAGKIVRPYTYELQGYPSRDREKAQTIAQHFGWPIRVVTVPTNDIRADFMRLAIEHRCRTKVQFEVSFPLPYLFKEIEEAEVWSGWNADEHYGNTRKVKLEQARMVRDGSSDTDRKQRLDAHRQLRFDDLKDPLSNDTWRFARSIAARHDKQLFDPYLDEAVRAFFLGFDHDQLSPLKKPVVREALAEELGDLAVTGLAVGVRLQIGGGVDRLFRKLLDDPFINRFETKYRSVSQLCQRWDREIEADPARFQAELALLPHPCQATSRTMQSQEYSAYTMADVRRSSAAPKFTVISMFSGGGGSSIGYRLAGGQVLRASEFVPEAARTYETNFPDCPVDRRDIREIIHGNGGVEGFLALAGLKPGEPDIIDGSPPCCEFSVAGKGISDPDEMRPYSDVKQRDISSLPFDFVDVALKARPKVVICENVPGLAFAPSRHILEGILRALRFPNGKSRTAPITVIGPCLRQATSACRRLVADSSLSACAGMSETLWGSAATTTCCESSPSLRTCR